MYQYKNIFRNLIMLLLVPLLFSLSVLPATAAGRAQDTDETIVIVLDPGHGGDNKGTQEGWALEKEMNLVTAKAAYDRLRQFDNVEVYLTHTDDTDLTLKERAEYAASVDADFLFSIHYNASENHNLFGTEVWISNEPPYHAYGYQFGYIHLTAMRDMGLFLRGIKTRLKDDGTDYYGIIRESAALEVPAVIIEHCHVDEERDKPFCDTSEDWEAFGRADADSIARYFGLKSTSLGIDYSQTGEELFPEVNAGARVQLALQDETAPDVCMIELAETDFDNNTVTLTVSAVDYDSFLIYYDYSLDGGNTYSRREIWPECDALAGTCRDVFTLEIPIPGGVSPQIKVRAHNLYNLYTESNLISIPQVFLSEEEKARQASEEAASEAASAASEAEGLEASQSRPGTQTFMPANAGAEPADKTVSFFKFLEVCLVIVVVLFVVVLSSQLIAAHNRRKRRQARKESLNRRNHPR